MVMQRPAKPRTPVRFRPWPPFDGFAFIPERESGSRSGHAWPHFSPELARVAKSVDAAGLKPVATQLAGSNPAPGIALVED